MLDTYAGHMLDTYAGRYKPNAKTLYAGRYTLDTCWTHAGHMLDGMLDTC